MHRTLIWSPPWLSEVWSDEPYLSLPAAKRGELRQHPRRRLFLGDLDFRSHRDVADVLALVGHDPRPALGDAVRDPEAQARARKRDRRASTRHANRGARGSPKPGGGSR